MHPTTQGRLAQLGEHLPYKEGVTGSRPVSPTTHSYLFFHQVNSFFLSEQFILRQENGKVRHLYFLW